MKNRRFALLASLLAALLLSACGSAREQAGDPDGTFVHVTNRNWVSMEIYVVGQSQRVRLGRISSGQSKRFTIPGHLLSGATPLRFEMESSGAQRDVLSEAFVVAPGDEVILIIPNTR
jgi:hypothetical protein